MRWEGMGGKGRKGRKGADGWKAVEWKMEGKHRDVGIAISSNHAVPRVFQSTASTPTLPPLV